MSSILATSLALRLPMHHGFEARFFQTVVRSDVADEVEVTPLGHLLGKEAQRPTFAARCTPA
ncbi:hypothetical protein [Deinococcus hopiensis]|uniref:hypothetical protein n=1 Tax=Deinococcus hopiensis TaxID=309885 RepID=UPI00111C7A84|nr:hypothetical protein [Deinococcus hopiensis]